MQKISLFLLCTALSALPALAQTPPLADPAPAAVPSYVGDRMRKPPDYRDWIYLSAGLDMSYNAGQAPDHHMFGNVFVDPAAYRAFRRSGTWPDKTTIVLEMRGARGSGSINRRGLYQDGDVMGLEVHVKDEARFPGMWAFFAFDGDAPARMIPTSANCYACHAAHAAVDTTFVQFYPTLLPLATARGTLSAAYLQDAAAAAAAAAAR